MLDRAPPDLGAREFAEAERVSQLIQEHGDAMVDFRLGWSWNRPAGDLGPAPPDDLLPIESNEFV